MTFRLSGGRATAAAADETEVGCAPPTGLRMNALFYLWRAQVVILPLTFKGRAYELTREDRRAMRLQHRAQWWFKKERAAAARLIAPSARRRPGSPLHTSQELLFMNIHAV